MAHACVEGDLLEEGAIIHKLSLGEDEFDARWTLKLSPNPSLMPPPQASPTKRMLRPRTLYPIHYQHLSDIVSFKKYLFCLSSQNLNRGTFIGWYTYGIYHGRGVWGTVKFWYLLWYCIFLRIACILYFFATYSFIYCRRILLWKRSKIL